MAATVLPYSPADTAAAAQWLDYVAQSYAGPESPYEANAAAREAIDKLERRQLIGPAVAALLAEIFDLPECAFA